MSNNEEISELQYKQIIEFYIAIKICLGLQQNSSLTSEVRRVVMYGDYERKGARKELWGDGLDLNSYYTDVFSLWKCLKFYNYDMCTYL